MNVPPDRLRELRAYPLRGFVTPHSVPIGTPLATPSGRPRDGPHRPVRNVTPAPIARTPPCARPPPALPVPRVSPTPPRGHRRPRRSALRSRRRRRRAGRPPDHLRCELAQVPAPARDGRPAGPPRSSPRRLTGAAARDES